jgi:hypothetical protein
MGFKDITGERYGRLLVIMPIKKDGRGEYFWICQCDCGNIKTISGNKLRSGNTRSCGCFREEHRGDNNRTHGMANNRLYTIWLNMRSRCYNPKNISYRNYGGRGISVCNEWRGSFEKFMDWSFYHGYNEALTIDRIDFNGNYSPQNCKWATKIEQANNKRNNHVINIDGEEKTISEWARIYGINCDTIERRINAYGWDEQIAVKTPVHMKGVGC